MNPARTTQQSDVLGCRQKGPWNTGMADKNKRLSTNVDGEFYVDSTCINCDTCRQLAPDTFVDTGNFSAVSNQPGSQEQVHMALQALVCCPTGSIGTVHPNGARDIMGDFPLLIEDGVYYAGFNSAKSYGSNSYFIKHADGNWLVDSPKFVRSLIEKIDELGGVRYIFLTHRDDVAEASKFVERFGSERIIHRDELSAEPESEIVLDGYDPIPFACEFLIFPTPGHTKGHCVLLYKNRYLFTGDTLYWDRERERLDVFSPRYCWYSWEEQTKSMAKMTDLTFQWVLPGHGQRAQVSPDQAGQQLLAIVERMQAL